MQKTQEELDALMKSEGAANYRKARERAASKNQEASTAPGRHLLRIAVQTLGQQLRKWVADAKRKPGRKHAATKLLQMVDHDVCAMITAQVILDQISRDRPYLTTASAIAAAVEDEARFSAFKRDHPAEWRDIHDLTDSKVESHRRRVIKAAVRKADESWVSWTRSEKRNLGTVLIELFAQSEEDGGTGLIKVVNRKRHVNKGAARKTNGSVGWEAIITAGDGVLDSIEDAHDRYEGISPLYLPMAVEPHPWVAPDEGGYDSNVFMRWSLFSVPKRRLKEMTYDRMPAVYDAVNALQRTPWRINDNVYAVFDHLWASGGGTAKLPPREEIALPPRTPLLIKHGKDGPPEGHEDCEDYEVAKRAWKHAAAKVHNENHELVGRRILTSKVHFVARNYQNQPFYFPYKVDFRGRIYPIPPFLHPQGNDLAKGLLQFDAGRPVDSRAAREWLMIHGANCFGLDKCPYDERIEWVEENEALIRASSEDPLGGHHWTEADDPWQFLAFCFEWDALRQAEEAGKVHVSHLPVAMDGTNNGLQLYSLILRDPKTAAATNVSASPAPRDIYQDVADIVTAKLVDDAGSSVEEVSMTSKHTGETTVLRVADMARTWLAFVEGKVPRKATKRSVMVVPYSGTIYACRKYVEKWYTEVISERGLRDNRPFPQTHTYCRYLADLVWAAIHEAVTGANVAMKWLQEVANRCTKAGTPIRWTTPSGFLVEQAEYKFKYKKIRTQVGKVLRYRNTAIEQDELSPISQRNGIAPNFIHSLDASVLTLTVNRCMDEGIHHFAMVHDSYATHAADAPQLALILREVVSEMFSEDLLQGFSAEVSASLECEANPLPCTPDYGTLDPACVLQSNYFFS